MSENRKFYRCSSCGNITLLVVNGGGEQVCCEKPMILLIPNTTEASIEKHIPIVSIDAGIVTVKVGSVAHPMTKEHYIQFICLVTENKTQIEYLTPDNQPEATFYIGEEKIEAVYEYCNIHGLWAAKLPADISDEINCHPDFSKGCI